MDTHLHPRSKRIVRGLRLGPYAEISKTDLYDATDGHWRPAGMSQSGVTIGQGCTTIWVRPNIELSENGRIILKYLVRFRFYLTYVRGMRCRVIPSISAKEDGRMDWVVNNPEVAEELMALGFVQPTRDDHEVYEPTDVGRAAL